MRQMPGPAPWQCAWGFSTSARPIAPRASTTAERLIRAISDRRMTLSPVCPVPVPDDALASRQKLAGRHIQPPSKSRLPLHPRCPSSSCLRLRHSSILPFHPQSRTLPAELTCLPAEPHSRYLLSLTVAYNTNCRPALRGEKKIMATPPAHAHCPSGRTTAVARISTINGRSVSAHSSAHPLA